MRPRLLTASIAAGLMAAAAGAASQTAPQASAAVAPQQVRAEQLRLEEARRGSEADAAAVRRDIQALQAQLLQLASAQTSDEAATGGQRARLMQLNARESELTARLGRNRNALARLLTVLELYRRDPPPALLVHPQSAKDAVRAAILVKAMAPELQRRGRALGQEAESIQRVRREVAGASETLFQSDSELAERRAEIEGLIVRKAALERSLMSDAAAAETALAALAQDAGSVGDLVNQLGLGSASELLPPAPGSFVAPVQGAVVRRFGDAVSGGRAQGWSYATGPEALVRAPTPGVVEYAGPLQGYGTVVILKIGGGYHLVMTGLAAAQAVAGGAVAAGEPVGRMADPARDQPAPLLYVELRKDGEPVDPAPWLRPAVSKSAVSGAGAG